MMSELKDKAFTVYMRDVGSERHKPVRAVALVDAESALASPIDMLLFCPHCGLQHIDAPDERTPDWTNPPHKTHLCHKCGHLFRPSDRPTNGVATITSKTVSDAGYETEVGDICEECGGDTAVGEGNTLAFCINCWNAVQAKLTAESDRAEEVEKRIRELEQDLTCVTDGPTVEDYQRSQRRIQELEERVADLEGRIANALL